MEVGRLLITDSGMAARGDRFISLTPDSYVRDMQKTF